jgi:hypothetical protein
VVSVPTHGDVKSAVVDFLGSPSTTVDTVYTTRVPGTSPTSRS